MNQTTFYKNWSRRNWRGRSDPVRQVSGDVMRKVEQNMLQAALVSWIVTRVMDGLLVIVPSIRTLTWEKTMKHLNTVIQSAETLVVNIVCSPAIVVGVLLEWLAHVTRAVGMFGNQRHLKSALLRGSALTTSHSAILLSELRCRKCTSRIYRMKEAA